MILLTSILQFFSIILPNYFLADINTVYDAKLAANNLKDEVVNSPIYGIVLYSGSIIIAFAVVVMVIFVLIVLLKK